MMEKLNVLGYYDVMESPVKTEHVKPHDLYHKRCPNFTQEEEELLITLVKERRTIINCKKTGCQSNRDKERAWTEVTDSFNRLHGDIFRDEKTLRKKYENMKKLAKKRFMERRSVMKKEPSCQQPERLTCDVDVDGDVLLDEVHSETILKGDENPYLRGRRSARLSLEATVKLAGARQILFETQRRHLEEVHELTVSHLREEHEMRLRILEVELKIRQAELCKTMHAASC